MDVLFTVFLVLHFVGLASLLGGFLVQVKDIGRGSGTVVAAMVHGALTQLVSGIVLAGLVSMGDGDTNHAKIAVKLAIALVITVVVFVFRTRVPAPSWALWTIGALTFANVVIAVAWR